MNLPLWSSLVYWTVWSHRASHGPGIHRKESSYLVDRQSLRKVFAVLQMKNWNKWIKYRHLSYRSEIAATVAPVTQRGISASQLWSAAVSSVSLCAEFWMKDLKSMGDDVRCSFLVCFKSLLNCRSLKVCCHWLDGLVPETEQTDEKFLSITIKGK